VADPVPLTQALSGKPAGAQAKSVLVKHGLQGKIQRLEPLGAPASLAPTAAPPPPESSEAIEATNTVLDKQAFNILLAAVQATGLPVGTDVITGVRDVEFRRGKWLSGFERMNSLSSRFAAAASQRQQQLARDDRYLSSMEATRQLSAREIERRKLHNQRERSKLSAAMHKFGIVVEGLRTLAHSGD
jgi:hypothetical protein